MRCRRFPEDCAELSDTAVEDSLQVVPGDIDGTCQSEPEHQRRRPGDNKIASSTLDDQTRIPAFHQQVSDRDSKIPDGLTRKDLAMFNLHTGSATQAASDGTAPDVKERADRLRDKLCLHRVRLDVERDRYLANCRFFEESAQEMMAFLTFNPNIAFGPQSSQLELQRLQDQAKLAQDALLQQSGVTRGLEAALRTLEARIARLGIWMVHIPDSTVDSE